MNVQSATAWTGIWLIMTRIFEDRSPRLLSSRYQYSLRKESEVILGNVFEVLLGAPMEDGSRSPGYVWSTELGQIMDSLLS